MDTTIRVSKKLKKQLDMLFAKDLSYNKRIELLISVLPEKALITLNKLKRTCKKTGETYLQATTRILNNGIRDSEKVIEIMGGSIKN